MQQQRMEQKSVSQLIQDHNFIVPEIQREYVWGRNEYNILAIFLKDIIEGEKNLVEKSQKNNAKILADLMKSGASSLDLMNNLKKEMEIAEKSASMNIGFLYSYRPNYYVHNDISKDVFLIDGQQRFTSLFLILFYLSLKENRLVDFKNSMRFNAVKEMIAFDYRVRTITHNFLIDLLNETQTLDDLLNIENRIWFLSEYTRDTSISNMVNSFKIIAAKFEDKNTDYYNFVFEKINFWHFKTDETTQGEELYITMNSRGRELADNENLFAKLLEKENKISINVGEKWEEYQDFFWKNRGGNDDAERGFNEFLNWIQLLKIIEKTTQGNKEQAELAIRARNNIRLNPDYFNFSEIDLYFQAVKYLFEELPKDCQKIVEVYPDCDVSTDLYLGKKLLFKEEIALVEYYRLLPVMELVKRKVEKSQTKSSQNIFRFIRFFFNNSRNSNVSKSITDSIINGVSAVQQFSSVEEVDVTDLLNSSVKLTTILFEEEKAKLKVYAASNPEKREKQEQIIWKMENHASNDGEISHLVDFSSFSVEYAALTYQSLIQFISHKGKILDYYLQGALLMIPSVYRESFYGDTFRFYFKNGNNSILAIRRKRFIEWIKAKPLDQNLSLFLDEKFNEYFSNIPDLTTSTDKREQLVAIFFVLFKKGIWKWEGLNIGCRSSSQDGRLFTTEEFLYQRFNKKFTNNSDKNLPVDKIEISDIEKLKSLNQS